MPSARGKTLREVGRSFLLGGTQGKKVAVRCQLRQSAPCLGTIAHKQALGCGSAPALPSSQASTWPCLNPAPGLPPVILGDFPQAPALKSCRGELPSGRLVPKAPLSSPRQPSRLSRGSHARQRPWEALLRNWEPLGGRLRVTHRGPSPWEDTHGCSDSAHVLLSEPSKGVSWKLPALQPRPGGLAAVWRMLRSCWGSYSSEARLVGLSRGAGSMQWDESGVLNRPGPSAAHGGECLLCPSQASPQ